MLPGRRCYDPSVLQSVISQARYARLVRPLWDVRDLAQVARIPVHYLRKDGTAPLPIAVNWYLTWACPEKCVFCEVEGAGHTGERRLSQADRLRLVDQLFPRMKILAVSGGEPLVAPDALPILERAASRGARIFIATNGVQLKKQEKARALAKIGPTLVNVSVVGGAERHDREFRRNGAFRDVTDGISTFLSHRDARRTRVCINCTVTLENVGDLESVVRLGRELGVDHVRFTWLSFLTPAEQIPGDEPTCLKVSRAQLDAFDAPAMAAEVERLEKLYPGFITFQPDLTRNQRISWYREGGGVYRACLPIWHTLFLRPDGQATACGHFLDEPLGQVLDADLPQLWNHPRLRHLRLAEERSAMCRRCCKI